MINFNEGRIGFEAIGNTYPPAENVTRENVTIAGIPCAWFTPTNINAADIAVFIHGGAFIFGSINSHAPMVSYIAQALKRKVLVIDYRLAPEHPFPAGIDDCVAVIQQLDLPFGIIGDSAGGNLTMATQLKLKAVNGPAPLYSIVISPWVDLTCTNESYIRNKLADTVLSREYLLEAANTYAGGRELSAALLSPVNAVFNDLAPVLIMCGTNEILEDDSINLHKHLIQSGVDATLELFEGELHVWPFMDIHTKASRKALSNMAHFVTKQTNK